MTVKRRLQESAERVNPVSSVHVWDPPGGSATDIRILTRLEVYTAIHNHAVQSLPNETGGFLMGHVAYDPMRQSWHVEIEEMVPVDPITQDPVHFSFSWRDVDRVRMLREEQGRALVGWYHTHPDLGVFLSQTDLEKTHRVLFAEPFQVALVYDPVRRRAGYFFWEGTQIIDAAPAAWREFGLAVQPAAEPVDAAPETVAAPEPTATGPAGPSEHVAPPAPPTPTHEPAGNSGGHVG